MNQPRPFYTNPLTWISGIVKAWPFFAGLAAGLIFILLPMLGFGLEYLPGDIGDGRFNIYILEHGYRYLMGLEPSFWNAGFMYPEPEIISYSDNLLGTMPIYASFRLIGLEKETAMQCWILAIWFLNYTSSYAFFKWMYRNRYASALGAVVFVFSLALQSQMTHAQVFPRFAIPLAFWAALLFVHNHKVKHFFFALLLVVYQLYCGIYLGLLLALPVGVILLVGYIGRVGEGKGGFLKWNGGLVLSTILNGIIALLLMLPYIRRSAEVPERFYENMADTIPTWKSYLYSKPGSLLWESLSSIGRDIPLPWDHQLFPGAMAFLSLIAFVVYTAVALVQSSHIVEHRRIKTAILVAVLFVYSFFIRFDFNSLYELIFVLPGYQSIGTASRIINVQLLFYGLATAWACSIILARVKSMQGSVFVLLLAALIADNHMDATQTYRFSKAEAQARLLPILEKMSTLPPGTLVSYESVEPLETNIALHLDAMLAAQELGLKSVNGYTGECPSEFSLFWREMTSEGRNYWLNHMNVDTSLVHVVPINP